MRKAFAGLPRSPGDMRGIDDAGRVLQVHKRRIGRKRLAEEHIQRRTLYEAFVESARKVLLDCDSAASGIDNHGAALHLLHLFIADKTGRALIVGGVDGHDVRTAE